MKNLFCKKRHDIDVVVVNQQSEKDIVASEINIDLEIMNGHVMGLVEEQIVSCVCYDHGEDMIKYFPVYYKTLQYARKIAEIINTTSVAFPHGVYWHEPEDRYNWYCLADTNILHDITSENLWQDFQNIDELKSLYKYYRKWYGMLKHLASKNQVSK